VTSQEIGDGPDPRSWVRAGCCFRVGPLGAPVGW
jgi:hypothetical protein